MNKQELIKKYEYMNHDCFRRVDVSEVLADLRQLDEPKQIKLKDVIVRMEGLSEHTRSEWLNDILYKFGSDYGTLKYKDGYEQGKLEGSMIPYEEPQKVTIPQFVADWIETCKENNIISLSGAFEYAKEEVDTWLSDWTNQKIFARAWLDGYEVEKEKRYEVILRNGQSLKTVYRQGDDHLDFELVYGDLERFTRKQLEEAGFGEVFNSPLFEVEEAGE